MRKQWPVVAALCLLAGCAPAPAPGTTATSPPAAVASPSDTPSPTRPPTTVATPAHPDGLPTPYPPGATSPGAGGPSATATPPEDSLEAAFAQPDNGGIGAFLSRHPDYLPGTVVIGDVIVSGAARGPLDLNLKNVPAGTTRMFMTIACVESLPYRMELTRADGSVVGASWADSCGFWGGLNGYTTTPFDPAAPPARFTINVAADTRYSYVLYASPGR